MNNEVVKGDMRVSLLITSHCNQDLKPGERILSRNAVNIWGCGGSHPRRPIMVLTIIVPPTAVQRMFPSGRVYVATNLGTSTFWNSIPRFL